MDELMLKLADDIVKHGGNLIEIGAGFGETTNLLAQVADKYGEQLFVIDPFIQDENVDPSYNVYPYKRFMDKTEYYREKGVIIHLRLSSDNPNLYNTLSKYSPFSFAFVDGVQTEAFVLNDLELMRRLFVQRICVDDYNRETAISQVPSAVKKFIDEHGDYKNVGTVSYPRDSSRVSVVLDIN